MVGEKIKMLRMSKELTQEALASELKINQRSLSLFETNKQIPTADILEKLAKIFGVPVEMLDDKTPFVILNGNTGSLNNINGTNTVQHQMDEKLLQNILTQLAEKDKQIAALNEIILQLTKK